MFPFKASLGYQPPLFDPRETESAVASIQWIQRQTCAGASGRHALQGCAHQRAQKQAYWHRALALLYKAGKTVWLAANDLPLQVEVRKLAPRYVGPFKVERMVNAAA